MAAKKTVDEVDLDRDACVLNFGPPAHFGWCTTHEQHFDMGGLCPGARARTERDLEQARAAGDAVATTRAERSLALDDEVAAGVFAPPECYHPVSEVEA